MSEGDFAWVTGLVVGRGAELSGPEGQAEILLKAQRGSRPGCRPQRRRHRHESFLGRSGGAAGSEVWECLLRMCRQSRCGEGGFGVCLQ